MHPRLATKEATAASLDRRECMSDSIARTTGTLLWEAPRELLEPDAAAGPSGALSRSKEVGHFGRILRAIGSEMDRGERYVSTLVGAAGKSPGSIQFDPASLIAAQAGIYRWGESVDLASRLVDRAGNAVRTTLQNGNS